MEQTRKLLADAFDKDPIKQQYCIFYVDHLLASGRISPEMTVSVLSTVAANATSETVRLDALRMMPQLLEQKTFRQELKPLLVRAIGSLIPTVTEVDVLRRQLMLDIQDLVEADPTYRKALIDQLSEMDRSWSIINSDGKLPADLKQVRVGIQIKLALLSLVQDYRLQQQIASSLVELAASSPELTRFVGDQLNMFSVSSPRTALRVVARSAKQAIDSGSQLPPPPNEGQDGLPPILVVAEDESQQTSAQRLARALEEDGIHVQGVDVISTAKEAKLNSPEKLEIRFSKSANGQPFLASMTDAVRKSTGQEPKIVSDSTAVDPGSYEIWLSSHKGARQ